MRICVFNWRDPRHPRAGGAEVYTHEVARRWAREHEVTWFTAAVPGAPSEEEVDGIRLVRRGSRLGVYAEARKFWRRPERGRYDLVIDEVNTRPFGCIRWVEDAPVVALIHQVAREVWHFEMPAPVALTGRYLLEPRWLRWYADAPVLTVSESSRASLQDYGLRDVRLVPEGLSAPARPAVPREQSPTLVFVGRLARNKRPLDAIAVHAAVRSVLPDAQLWIIGDGPDRARCERAAAPGVTFFGRVDEQRKYELMARAHLLLATSVREGWCLVVDEAAAAGTPTVGYDVPGLRDSVPAAGGVLVPPTPAAAATAVLHGLDGWRRRPAVAGWRGGTRSWDEVAREVLLAACAPAPGLAGGRLVTPAP
jgi:glycosyltransferase involved in cell wall biosynthesis